jgi:chromosome segregation ATPase
VSQGETEVFLNMLKAALDPLYTRFDRMEEKFDQGLRELKNATYPREVADAKYAALWREIEALKEKVTELESRGEKKWQRWAWASGIISTMLAILRYANILH